MNRIFRILFLPTILLCISMAPCNEVNSFKIEIEPLFDSITIKSGLIAVDDMEAEVYKNIDDWNIIPIKGSKYNIKYTMHQGSGKYWTIGIVDSASGKSAFYFNTTTIGFRNVYEYVDGALPWINDFNNDGIDEIIIWNSYLAFESGTNGDYGLVAWVYEKKADHKFEVNYDYSSQVWGKIISSYKNREISKEGLISGKNVQISKSKNIIDRKLDVLIKSLELKINEVKSKNGTISN